MKINEVSKNTINISEHANPQRVKETDSSRAFHRQLTNMENQQYEEHIRALATKIFEQGERVAKKADMKELQKYREMITELLNETVSNGYEFSKSTNFDRRGRHRIFATINKVNESLDEMAQDILSGQSDNLKLLHKVDDIRGMLVDLFF